MAVKRFNSHRVSSATSFFWAIKNFAQVNKKAQLVAFYQQLSLLSRKTSDCPLKEPSLCFNKDSLTYSSRGGVTMIVPDSTAVGAVIATT